MDYNNDNEIIALLQSDAFANSGSLLDGLNSDQIGTLVEISTVRSYEAGKTIAQEGQESAHLYLILGGEVAVLKQDQEQHQLIVATVGHCLGELALASQKMRTATLKAKSETHLLEVPIDILRDDIQHKEVCDKLTGNVSTLLAERLNVTSSIAANAMAEKITELDLRINQGIFMVTMLSILSLYTITLRIIVDYQTNFSSTTTTSLMIMLFFLISIFYVIKRSSFPIAEYGLHLRNWKSDIGFAILATLPLILFASLIKAGLVHFMGGTFFTPYASFIKAYPDGAVPITTHIATIAAYAAFCPIQEFLTRGCLQTSLQKFLIQANPWPAIVLSNLLFAAAHSHTSMMLTLLAFIPGLFWGWLFFRQRSLIGVAVSHIIFGVYCLYVLGFPQLVS